MFPPPTIVIEHHPQEGILIARWPGEQNLSVTQAEYTALLGAGMVRNIACWLLDVRTRPVPDPELAEWTVRYWLPHAIQCLAPHRLRIAYLLTQQRADYLEADANLRQKLHWALQRDLPFDMAVFKCEDAARRWLQQECVEPARVSASPSRPE